MHYRAITMNMLMMMVGTPTSTSGEESHIQHALTHLPPRCFLNSLRPIQYQSHPSHLPPPQVSPGLVTLNTAPVSLLTPLLPPPPQVSFGFVTGGVSQGPAPAPPRACPAHHVGLPHLWRHVALRGALPLLPPPLPHLRPRDGPVDRHPPGVHPRGRAGGLHEA